MKKIYSLVILAAMGSAVAFAGQRQQAEMLNIKSVDARVMENVAEINAKSTKGAKTISKVEAMTDLNGLYDWGFESLLSSTPTPELTITITDEETGAAIISGLMQNFKISATVDLSAGTFSIANNQYLGKDSYGDENYFYLKTVNEDGDVTDGATDAEASVGTISEDGTTITFPSLDIWAIGDPNDESLGWWIMTYNNEFTLQKERVLYGMATVSGDFYYTTFVDGTPEDYEVEVYTNVDDQSTLLVKNPMKGLYAALGFNGESPDMVIDVTDNDNVIIPQFSLGVSSQTQGLYYGMSASYYYEEIEETTTPEESRITFKEDRENNVAVLTIPYNGMLLWPSYTTTLYVAVNDEAGVTFTIPLEPSAVEEISNNAAQTPVYYNLQGMRVNEPAAGQLLIKKQGDKVSKVIVK